MKKVVVNEAYQSGYQYSLEEAMGAHFRPDFKPQLSPKEMLGLGIFGGAYFSEPPHEFPSDWFDGVPLSPSGTADKSYNFFKVLASQPLAVWLRKGWIYPEDPKGWFLWYCRYYQGRRIPEEDDRQIRRWKNMHRHIVQLQNNCQTGDVSCRPRQRQALLHWAYDSRSL
jgi:hypothetical protein